MHGTFIVRIKTGNDAMSEAHDIAGALNSVAADLRRGKVSGKVFDLNGNTVGSFELTADTDTAPKYRRPYERK